MSSIDVDNLRVSGSENHQVFSIKSKVALVAIAVAGVAGIVIVILGAVDLFGPVGKVGFIAAISAGGGCALLATGGMIWIVAINCTKSATTHAPVSADPLPENKDAVSPAISQSVPETPTPTASVDGEKKYHERRAQFYAITKARCEKQPLPSAAELPDCNLEEFKKNAEEAFEYSTHMMYSPSMHKFGGGQHVCVITDKIPGVLFKRQVNLEEMAGHVTLLDRARKICEDYGLNLLYVPRCKVVDFNHRYVVEEVVRLLGGGRWQSQKGYYQWAISDPQLQSYLKEIFRQLTLYICLTGFSDVKYNNISLIEDGRVALFDVDEGGVFGRESGSLSGLKKLFRMMPLEWCEEFIKVAEPHLSPDKLKALHEELPKIRAEKEKKREKQEKKAQFYATKAITHPAQSLVFDKAKFKKYEPEVAFFAEKAIALLNQQIPHLPLVSMGQGRKLSLGTTKDHPMRATMAEVKMNSWDKFTALQEKGLKALQEQGYIFSYRIENSYYYFSVIC